MGIQSFLIDLSGYDPCLFMGDHILCVLYVDDYLLFSKEDSYINSFIEKICD